MTDFTLYHMFRPGESITDWKKVQEQNITHTTSYIPQINTDVCMNKIYRIHQCTPTAEFIP